MHPHDFGPYEPYLTHLETPENFDHPPMCWSARVKGKMKLADIVLINISV